MTISEEISASGGTWRIHYGPRDFINCRGGDFIVFVDERGETIQRTQRGQ